MSSERAQAESTLLSRTVFRLKSLATIILGAFLLQLASPALAADTPLFPDIANSWYLYRDAIVTLKDRGVIDGYPDGTFKPQKTVNRAEFLKLVFAAKESEGGVRDGCFSDVPEGAWFAPFVCAAAHRDIAKGYPDGTFRPEQDVNWAEAIALTTRAYGWDIQEKKGNNWYAPIVQELDHRGILAEHSYVPWAPLTRERAADLIYRMLQEEQGRTFDTSPGCSAGDGKVPESVTVNGKEQSFLISVPSTAERNHPTPLLIAFHGRTNSNEMVRGYMHFEREAPEMIVVYPEGTKATSGNGYIWTGPDGRPDVALFDTLVEQLGKHLCIDMNKIYVTGHSLGAWMANSMACLRGGVIRASGSVGGDGISNGCTGPVAGFIAHNPKDTLSPIEGSERIREKRVELNACSWKTVDTQPQSLLCVKHTGCASGNDVVWCPHEVDTDERGKFYPHTWPRGTAKAMVEFFRGLDN